MDDAVICLLESLCYSLNRSEAVLKFCFFSGTGFCAGKANGNYRDPDNCHGFIQCSNQIVYKQNCNPLWLKYNERKDQCDWPQNVQCDQGRFKTLSFKRYFTAARSSC